MNRLPRRLAGAAAYFIAGFSVEFVWLAYRRNFQLRHEFQVVQGKQGLDLWLALATIVLFYYLASALGFLTGHLFLGSMLANAKVRRIAISGALTALLPVLLVHWLPFLRFEGFMGIPYPYDLHAAFLIVGLIAGTVSAIIVAGCPRGSAR